MIFFISRSSVLILFTENQNKGRGAAASTTYRRLVRFGDMIKKSAFVIITTEIKTAEFTTSKLGRKIYFIKQYSARRTLIIVRLVVTFYSNLLSPSFFLSVFLLVCNVLDYLVEHKKADGPFQLLLMKGHLHRIDNINFISRTVPSGAKYPLVHSFLHECTQSAFFSQ